MGKKVAQKKEDVWHCYHCSKKINSKEKHTGLLTKDKGEVVEEVYFHIKCWSDYFNAKVLEKAKNNVSALQEQAQSLFGLLKGKGFLDGVQGIDKLAQGLNIDLSGITKEDEENRRAKPTKQSK